MYTTFVPIMEACQNVTFICYIFNMSHSIDYIKKCWKMRNVTFINMWKINVYRLCPPSICDFPNVYNCCDIFKCDIFIMLHCN